jgi:PTH1 family peptidyl-tRNA hydrolase
VILVAGLGNPGPRYASTRHNLGFMALERLAERSGGAEFQSKFHGNFAKVTIAGSAVGLLEPLTYMNESGKSVGAALSFFKLAPEELLVLHDELDLPWGQVRLKVGGGEAGHRGLLSVSQAVGGGYVRLRLGIGRPPLDFPGTPADFVLEAPSPAERAELDALLDRAVDAAMLVIARGVSVAMNATNQRKPR